MRLYCPTCDKDREVVLLRQDIFNRPAKRVYYCPDGHEIIEAVR